MGVRRPGGWSSSLTASHTTSPPSNINLHYWQLSSQKRDRLWLHAAAMTQQSSRVKEQFDIATGWTTTGAHWCRSPICWGQPPSACPTKQDYMQSYMRMRHHRSRDYQGPTSKTMSHTLGFGGGTYEPLLIWLYLLLYAECFATALLLLC